MDRYHFYVMRANFSCQLRYLDCSMDSLLYKVESDDLYYELEKQTQDVKNFLNFSSYYDSQALRSDKQMQSPKN